MGTYGWDIQKAIYGLLTASSPSLVNGRVYDGVAPTQGILYPFIVIGESQPLASDTTNSAGGSDSGIEEAITLHLWDRPNDTEAGTGLGFARIKQLASEVYAAMHEQAPVVEGRSVLIFFDNSRFFVDPDGRTRHGVMQFTVFHRS